MTGSGTVAGGVSAEGLAAVQAEEGVVQARATSLHVDPGGTRPSATPLTLRTWLALPLEHRVHNGS